MSMSAPVNETPAELARRVGQVMFAADKASSEFMQMELLACEPGHAVMRMKVRAPLLNGLQICHGGFIFTLADSTFAFACNSDGVPTVAAAASIDFLSAAVLGDTLLATAVEVWRGGRSGLYEVRVEKQTGEVVALFRGRSHRIAGGRPAQGAEK